MRDYESISGDNHSDSEEIIEVKIIKFFLL